MSTTIYTKHCQPNTSPPEIAFISMAYLVGRTKAQTLLAKGKKFRGAYEIANATGFERKTLQWQAAMLAAQHLDAHHITLDIHDHVAELTSK